MSLIGKSVRIGNRLTRPDDENGYRVRIVESCTVLVGRNGNWQMGRCT
jgi:hypothetical protein